MKTADSKDMTALLELASRVEAAEGADRELDALIWCALNGKRYVRHNEAYSPYGQGNPRTQVEYTEPPKRSRLVTRDSTHAQPWTSSLDAAMSLAKGQEWCGGAAGLLREAMDRLFMNFGNKVATFTPDAYREALARFMTAACLRAIAAQGGAA